jgi:DNA-binding NtrC family response regulator
MPEPVFIGNSTFVRELKSKIDLIAQSHVPVLITGESGGGKEVIARLIHYRNSDNSKPFVAINAAALPKDVVDNELFGHEKEAFTGAVSKTPGCFELAHNGTLFLDEVAEMHPQTQAKLLRAIENKTFRRLGGREEVHVDTRVVAATNRDIQTALKAGDLREDLYYRLSVIEIHLPPLRERKEDIPELIQHFMTMFALKYEKPERTFSKGAFEAMMAYDWPGNIRELRNLVERVMVVRPCDVIDIQELPARISNCKPPAMSVTIPIGTTLDEAKRLVIEQTLAAVNNNRSAAARMLGVSRRTLTGR